MDKTERAVNREFSTGRIQHEITRTAAAALLRAPAKLPKAFAIPIPKLLTKAHRRKARKA